MELRSNRDFWAGLMFAAIGAGAIFIAQDYRFGSTLRMGPGYFPALLGGILLVFGILIVLKGLRRKQKFKGRMSSGAWRAFSVLPLTLILFAVLIESAGFLPALVSLCVASAAAGSEFKIGEVSLLTLVLVFLSLALFIWGLELPYPLLKGF